MIRKVKTEDATGLCEIYNPYIRNTVISFEEQELTAADMQARICQISASYPWLVAEAPTGQLLGYAYASAWKNRSAYRFAVESAIYLAPEATGQGLGQQLYSHLLADLRSLGMHAVMAGIALPNPASVALHEKMGFQKVAHFQQVGYKQAQWLDVAYWQLLL